MKTTKKVNKQNYSIVEFNNGYFGICENQTGKYLVFGGDSACEDHYNFEYIKSVYDNWNGLLHYCGHYGYRIEPN